MSGLGMYRNCRVVGQIYEIDECGGNKLIFMSDEAAYLILPDHQLQEPPIVLAVPLTDVRD